MTPSRLHALLSSSWRGALLAVTPALLAIALHPGLVTQDGPAHLYNAHIVACSFDASSPFQRSFMVRWEPLPNWAGHLAGVALVSILPPRAADRVLTAATLALFAAALGWLRGASRENIGEIGSALLAGMLALNITWLFGFTSFLLGAALFPVTLGVWWAGRDHGFSWRRAALLATLAVLGYFCHLVSLGLTAFSLIVLEAATPGRDRHGRARATALGLVPLLPLGLMYVRLMRRGGGIAPRWHHLSAVPSFRSWWTQLGWVDPISLARKDVAPFFAGESPWFGLCAPVLWLGLGLLIAIATSRRQRERLGWWILGSALILGGILAPDTLGASHGGYLPQRIVLLGLAALAPVVHFGRLATAALAIALTLQTLTVFDYARHSDRTAGRLFQAAEALGRDQRVATLLRDIRSRFRANPLLHADCALGVGTRNVFYSDYETLYYYFPVHFRADVPHPDPSAFERLALLDDAPRARLWSEILHDHGDAIDAVLAWNADATSRALTRAAGFRVVFEDGPVTVWRREATRAMSALNSGSDFSRGDHSIPP